MNFSPDVLALNPELAQVAPAKKRKTASHPTEPKSTRPLLKILETAVKDKMHLYHCPEHGESCPAVVGGVRWTPANGRMGQVRFQCGHIVTGSL